MSALPWTPNAETAFTFRLRHRPSVRAARAIDQMIGFAGAARPIAFVSGFWRSGTTWAQELLAASFRAKTVFEPLSPHHPLRDRQLKDAGLLDDHLREAFIPGRAAPGDPLWSYLDSAFLGLVNSRESMRCRNSVSESLRRAVVLKDVRLQLNLEAVHARYGVPIIHVRRHPCGVVASLLAAKWKWSFEHVRLEDILRAFMDEPGMAGVCDGLTGKSFDVDAVSRIAAYWAVTERFAEQALRDRPWANIVPYETAVPSPRAVVADACRLIGRAPVRREVSSRESATTIAALRGTDMRLRALAWQSILPASDIARILDIVGAIFPQALDDTPAVPA